MPLTFPSKTKLLRDLLLAGATCAGVAGAGQFGCSSGQAEPGDGQGNGGEPATGGEQGNPGDVGNVSLGLSLPDGETINNVGYTLRDASGNVIALTGGQNPGTVNVSSSASIHFTIGGIPAGTGDSITLTATSSGGATCVGTATNITITPRQTSSVTVQVFCSVGGADAGSLNVTATPSFCGTWNSLVSGSNGSEAYVGETITLIASGAGADPNNVGYSWSQATPDGGSPIGVLGTAADEAAGPTDANTFLCTAPGTTTVTVVVDDGALPAGTTCPAAQTTTQINVTCDAVPAGQVNSAWVELGPNGAAVARAITAASACPNITINGTAQPMNLRIAAGTEPLRTTTSTSLGPQYVKASAFPVNTCEFALPAGTTSAVVAGRSLPLPKANPTKMIIMGDTGCRMKAAIPASGSQFQGCSDPTQFPLAQLSSLAASLQPDVVLHVGDYQYRENECPPNQANCAGSPWGYGWDTWEADFFQPAANLLAAAPWIVTRGNHEQCTRAGQGWFRFLDPNAYSESRSCNAAANDAVLQSDGTFLGGAYSDPYAVPVGANSQVIVFDSNNVGSAAVTSGGNSNFITYQKEIQAAGAFATSNQIYNIWSNHHPILGFAPLAGAPPAGGSPNLLSVMQATYPQTLFPPNINLVTHGHVHDFQAIDFTSTNYPATIVTGNAGTLLDVALPDPFPTSVHPDLQGNVTVSTIADTSGFGFIFAQYTGGVWVLTEYGLDGKVRTVCTAQLNGQMSCSVDGYIP